jgi:hypothetical protein
MHRSRVGSRRGEAHSEVTRWLKREERSSSLRALVHEVEMAAVIICAVLSGSASIDLCRQVHRKSETRRQIRQKERMNTGEGGRGLGWRLSVLHELLRGHVDGLALVGLVTERELGLGLRLDELALGGEAGSLGLGGDAGRRLGGSHGEG